MQYFNLHILSRKVNHLLKGFAANVMIHCSKI